MILLPTVEVLVAFGSWAETLRGYGGSCVADLGWENHDNGRSLWLTL